MKCEICGIRNAVTSYIEEKNGEKQMVLVCEECLQNQENKEELKCDVCGMSYREFLKTGILGCENCYRVFKTQTIKVLEKQILKNKYEIECNKKLLPVKSHLKERKKNEQKEFLKKLEELLELAKKEKDQEKIERIEQEIKKMKEVEFEKN